MKVELSDGRVIQVLRPSLTKAYALAGKKFPEPQPPVRTDKTVTGKDVSMIIEDDPEYLEAHEQWEEDVQTAAEEAILLLALRKENPPEDFSAEEFTETVLYFDEDYVPRMGKMGQKLDWIEWDLLGNTEDWVLVQTKIQSLLGIEEEVADQTEESFPSDLEGEASEPLDEAGDGEE